MFVNQYMLNPAEDILVNVPLNLYCIKCDSLMPKGSVAHKYSDADFYHRHCPDDVPVKQESTTVRGFHEYRDAAGNLYVNRDTPHPNWGVRDR